MRRVLTITSLLCLLIGGTLTTLAQIGANQVNTQIPTPTARATLPAPQPNPTAILPASARVPILMYHYLSVPPPNADKYRLDLSVTPENFEAQLKYLSDNGYTTISLYDLHAHLNQGKALPAKPIILTFDDGYRDAYTNAFPLLKKYKMTATFFVVSDFIYAGTPDYLTWFQVILMSNAGMSIENHSRTHLDLRSRDEAKWAWEFLGPQESIQYFTGKRPMFFCYPSGRYDAGLVKFLKSANIHGAVTTEYGNLHTLADAYTWKRLRIHGTTTVDQFAALIR